MTTQDTTPSTTPVAAPTPTAPARKPLTASRKDFKRVIQDDPTDTGEDSLGKYSDTPGPGAIDRKAICPCYSRNEFRYFNPANYDPKDPDADKYASAYYHRAESRNYGEWGYQGIRASVVLAIPMGNHTILHRVESPGVWGVESDCGEEYRNEVFVDECSTLAEMLAAMGVVVTE